MADEVDALMAIRGSLETTDGIDLIRGLAELGNLYSLVSTETAKVCSKCKAGLHLPCFNNAQGSSL